MSKSLLLSFTLHVKLYISNFVDSSFCYPLLKAGLGKKEVEIPYRHSHENHLLSLRYLEQVANVCLFVHLQRIYPLTQMVIFSTIVVTTVSLVFILMILYCLLRKGCKKNRNVNFFQIGVDPPSPPQNVKF